MAFKLIKAQQVRDIVHYERLVTSKKFLDKLDYELKQLIKNACERAKLRHRRILWPEDFF